MAIGAQVISGDKLIAFGKELQSLGYRVGEHPSFGGVHPTAHTRGSWHDDGLAIDVTYPGTATKSREMLNKAVDLAKARGITGIIWWSYGHYGHAHFDVSGWRRIGSNTGSVVFKPGDDIPEGSGSGGGGLFSNPLQPLLDLISALSNPKTWIRIGQVVLGLLLILFGLFSVNKVKDTVATAGKGIKNGFTKS